MNERKKNYRYFVNYKGTRTRVTSLGDTTVNWELIENSFYWEQRVGSFTLTGDDYKLIKAIEDAGDICGDIFIEVEKKCSGDWELYAKSRFTVQDVEWNNSKCNLQVNPDVFGGGSCLIEKGQDEIDILDEIAFDGAAEMSDFEEFDVLGFDSGRIFIYNTASLEDILVIPVLDGSGDPLPDPSVEDLMGAGLINPDEKDYIRISLFGIVTKFLAPDWKIFVAWTYRRTLVKVAGECQPVPSGYTLVDDTGPNCSFFRRPTSEDNSFAFATQPTLFGECPVPAVPADRDVIWSCVHAGDPDYPLGFFAIQPHKDLLNSYGTFSLEVVLQVFLDKCNITQTVSDFFQINPENPSTINPITGLTSHTNDIRFIPRGNAIFPSFANTLISIMTWNQLTDFLREAFNCWWTIDLNGDLRIEHFSFFDNISIGLDATVGIKAKFTNEEFDYTYKRELLPFIEDFFQPDFVNFNFEDRRITYLDPAGNKLPCVGDSELDHSYGFSTDLEFFVEFPTDGPRDGWVCVAVNIVFGASNPPILDEDALLNGPLSTKRLVERYFKHGRFADLGKLQGIDVTFETTVRLKEEDELAFPICCEDDFDPRLIVKTPNGLARVISATHDLKTNLLTLKNEY